MSDVKAELHRSLQATRHGVLSRLAGLREYDLRRPMTPTGTNLLGIVALYQRACAHADVTVAGLGLDAPGLVGHWEPAERRTTLGALLILMIWETAQHAGHADIIRELIDGTAGADHDQVLGADGWHEYVAGIAAAANTFPHGWPARGYATRRAKAAYQRSSSGIKRRASRA